MEQSTDRGAGERPGMRILMTLPWGENLGGAEQQLQVILDGMDETPHEIEPVFFAHGPWPKQLEEAGFRVEVVDAGRLRQLHTWAATVWRLRNIMRERQPDLIVNWSAKTQLYGAPAAILAGMTDRNIWWQQAITEPHVVVDRLATLLPAQAIGCNSETGAKAQQRLRPHRPTMVWYAGTAMPEPGPPQPPPLQRPEGVPLVGLVGRLQPWKGQDQLLRAQAILRDRGRPMHLVLVGGDSYELSHEYAQSLTPLADSLGLKDSVTMTGEVPDAGPYMEQMDILVNASDPEPFGNVIVEGMARKVPVVAVNSGGPGEYLDNDRTAMLAATNRPEDLADALEPLLASESKRAELAVAGHELFMREFTEVAMRRRWFECLESVRDGRPRGVPLGAAQPATTS